MIDASDIRGESLQPHQQVILRCSKKPGSILNYVVFGSVPMAV